MIDSGALPETLSIPAGARKAKLRVHPSDFAYYEWVKFNAEAASIKQAEETTLDLAHLLQSIAGSGGLSAVAGQQKNLALRRAVESYLAATKASNRASGGEVLAAKQSFLNTARRICTSELPNLRATLAYDYFQRRANEEQALRSGLSKLFDKLYNLQTEESSRERQKPMH